MSETSRRLGVFDFVAGRSIRARRRNTILLAVLPPVVFLSALAGGLEIAEAASAPDLPLPVLILLGAMGAAGLVAAVTLAQVAAAAKRLETAVRAGVPQRVPPCLREFDSLRSTLSRVLESNVDLEHELQVLAAERDAAADKINRLAAQLQQHTERFQALVLNSADIIFVVNGSGLITYFTPSLTTLLGARLRTLTPLSAIIHADDLETLQAAIVGAAGESSNDDSSVSPSKSGVEFRIKAASGEWRTFDGVLSNLTAHRGVGGVVVNGRDVSATKEMQGALTEQAFYDPLTGLPNRSLLMDRLNQSIRTMNRSGKNVSVLFIDVDRFKDVNDTLGHAAGDALLAALTERIRESLRSDETLGRFGGDEFILITDADEDRAAAVAGRLLGQFEQPLLGGGREVLVTISIGVATVSRAPDSAEEMLRRADVALMSRSIRRRLRGRAVTRSTSQRTTCSLPSASRSKRICSARRTGAN